MVTAASKKIDPSCPNAGILGSTEERAEEAVITKLFTVVANNVSIDGLKFIDEGVIAIGGNNTNVTRLCACPGPCLWKHSI